jgi:catechol 2,3-dioxygenase-like lactoylglutathione lyase family enzyme
MFKKIDHINIVVQDLKTAKEFFLDLGFVVVAEGALEGNWIEKIVNLKNVKAKYIALNIPQTETNLELIQYFSPKGERDPLTGKPNQIGFRHLALEVSDIQAVVARLKKKGVTFFSEIQIYNNKKKLCYFLGPEGIILELAEYY